MKNGDFREKFSALQRASGGAIRMEDVPTLLGMSKPAARKLMSRWEKQGWVARIKRGLYLTLPLEAESSDRWAEDPWIIGTLLFSPCYLAGWSACEHWGLTEQIFRDVVAFTTKPLREIQQTVLSTTFKLKKVTPDKMFGLSTVWRGRIKTQVSDPSRTIVDLFNDPSCAGGFRQALTVFTSYMKSKDKNLPQLLGYLNTFGNKTLFKRLGYVVESSFPSEKDFIEACKARFSQGYSLLDPNSPPSGSFVRRWNLRINKGLTTA